MVTGCSVKSRPWIGAYRSLSTQQIRTPWPDGGLTPSTTRSRIAATSSPGYSLMVSSQSLKSAGPYEIEDCRALVAGLLADGVVAEPDVLRLDGRLFFADAVAASDPQAAGPRLYFQRVPEPKTAKNRMHLDVPVDADQLDDEVERLRASGATLTGFNAYPGHRAALLRDIEGNEFDLH